MALAVPLDQFRTNYVLLAPQDYRADYINVVAPTGARVLLDGDPIPASAWSRVGERGEFEAATLEVEDGFHQLEGEVAFGVVSYGYDCHVSYAFPGGLNLETTLD